MLLLDELLAWSLEEVRATVCVRQGNPFLRSDGLLERAAFAELFAQCFAAGAGANLRDNGEHIPTVGYLAALRDVEVLGDARLGQQLIVATHTKAFFNGIVVAEGEVRAGKKLLARGTFKIFIPENV